MRPLAAIERFFERLLERPSARLFGARLQPVQIQRRIERAMESRRLTSADRTLVPNHFSVRLNPADMAAFESFASSLAADLADGALAYARARRYAVVDRPSVELSASDGTPVGEIRVDADFSEKPGHGGAADGFVDLAGAPAEGYRDTRTRVFEVPSVSGPAVRLRVIPAAGAGRELELESGLLTIGRASDNGLALRDGKVSRYHARLQVRSGTLVLSDLGSTNGTRVNDVPVEEVVLGDGDRIEIGDTVIVVEGTPDGG